MGGIPEIGSPHAITMLYLFHGLDTRKSAEKAHSLVGSLRTKRPDAAFVVVDADHWSVSIIEEHLGGQGLFSNKYIVFLDRVTENPDAEEKIVDFIPAMNESANIFIVLEGKLNAELKKMFEKHAEKMVESGMTPAVSGDRISVGADARPSLVGKKEFNIFTLADALGARDSFKVWSTYRQAVENGVEAESIVGTLFWQVKSMILAAKVKNAAEAGLNPFVYGKSKRYAVNFSDGELRRLLKELIVLYHEGHRGTVDLEIGVERVLLSIGRKTR